MNKRISDHLLKISELKRLAKHNSYQYGSYRKAADVIRNLNFELTPDYDFKSLRGVGAAIDSEIREFLECGDKTPRFKKYYSEISAEYIANDEEVKDSILDFFTEFGSDYKVSVAGSIRRNSPFIRDVDLLTTAPAKVIYDMLEKSARFEYVYGADRKVRFKDVFLDLEYDIKMCPEESWIPCLLHSTGSAAHNIQMRARAKKLGLTLNEYGLFDKDKPVRQCYTDEREIFEDLGMIYISPEYR